MSSTTECCLASVLDALSMLRSGQVVVANVVMLAALKLQVKELRAQGQLETCSKRLGTSERADAVKDEIKRIFSVEGLTLTRLWTRREARTSFRLAS